MINATFDSLINIAKFDIGNGIDNFFFKAKLNNSEILFYIDGSSKVLVEDFGCMRNNKWIQSEPNQYQLDKMQKIIDDKIKNFPVNEQDLFDEDFDGNYHKFYGVHEKDFY